MNSFNSAFFQKYQEIKKIPVCSVDDFVALHNILGGKTVYIYLGITETDVDRTFLHNCSTDRECFEREFNGLNFNTFKQAEFIFKDEHNFKAYKDFLEYHKIEMILFDTHYDDERKIIEICKAMQCTRSEATAIFEAAKKCNTPTPIMKNADNVLQIQDDEKLNSPTELSNEIKVLSELLLELNSRSIKADIEHDEIFSYTSYACDTHKKFAPRIIEYFLNQWRSIQEANDYIINQFLNKYDDFAKLNIENLLSDFDLLPSAQILSSTHMFGKKRYSEEVEPVLTGCENFFISKCNERKNYIIHKNIEERLQHTRDISNVIMEVISDFVDDKSFAKKEIAENRCDDSLLRAARIYLVTVRLNNINAYLSKISLEVRALYEEMHQIARELRLQNDKLRQIKEEYEAAFLGEQVLFELKDVSIFSRKTRKNEKKNELEIQSVLLNNLKKYCRFQ